MLVSDGKYLVYGANGIIGRYDEYNHEQPEVLMTCRGATCGSINISKPFSWINGNAMVVHPKYNNLGQSFLKYLLQGIDLSCVITGAAQPQITRQSLQPVKVVVPPIAEQEMIVAELDCLTGIIEKKKQQLEELDKLAQSIFYDMFGDPITNEKGWETLPIRGAAPQTAYKGDIPSRDGKYWLLNLDMVEAQTGTILEEVLFDEKEIGGSTTTFNEDMVLYSKLRPYLNKVVLPMKSGYGTSELVPLLPDKSILNRYFLAYLLRSPSFVAYISLKVAGAKMPRVSLDVFRSFPVILPPLALQNDFAQKIEAIDKQKELIKQSIQETETLFNSRMDYWFN